MYFLVDFENVRSNGLRGAAYLEESDCLTIFFSNAARSCETRYLEEIEKSGCQFDTCKLINPGKNGLDFYIASRIGEFYGSGRRDRAVIISKDQGFKAVRDYWEMRLPPDKSILIAPSIEQSLIASNDNTERVKILKRNLAGVEIDVFQAKYEERMKLRKTLQNVFRGSELADKMPEIQTMVETGKAPKIIYLDALRRFGKKQGLEIYQRLKPVLHSEILQE